MGTVSIYALVSGKGAVYLCWEPLCYRAVEIVGSRLSGKGELHPGNGQRMQTSDKRQEKP